MSTHALRPTCLRRRQVLLLTASALLLLGLDTRVLAGPKPPAASHILIEATQLEKKLQEPGWRILDTRPDDEYAKGHIPGAVRVDVKTWQGQGKKQDGFRDAKAWAELVGKLGIRRDSHVVVYGSSLTDTARIWWTLKYLGMEHVAILDGGWSAWTKAKLATETAAAAPKRAVFEPKFQPDRLEEHDAMKKSLKADKIKIVDARSDEEFQGTVNKGKRPGRIPGAAHLEWKELLADDGRFKTPAELRDLFRKRGILPDATAICY